MIDSVGKTLHKVDELAKKVVRESNDPLLRKSYRDALRIDNFLRKFRDKEGVIQEDKAFEALNQLDTKSGRTMFKINKLKDIADKQGVNLQDVADLLMARKDLKNTDWVPTSGGSYATGRSMGVGLLGMALGGGTPLAAAGGVLGTGPKAMKFYGNVLGATNRGIKKTLRDTGLTRSEISRGLWNSAQQRTQKELKKYNQQP